MNPNTFTHFFKTKSGKLVAFGVLLAVGLVIFSVVRNRSIHDGGLVPPNGTNEMSKPQVVHSVKRLMQLFSLPPVPPPPTNAPTTPVDPKPSPLPTASAVPTLAPISLLADSAAGLTAPKKLSAMFAPYGRLIPCETIITVDSASIQTPIVGLVTDNVYFGGKLIIPAGTEIHGTAQTDHQRERIASGSAWTLVWQNGQELQLRAIALDRDFEDQTNHTGWAITDGSAGLRGELIKSDNLADIKLFAATFLSGAASSLTEKQQTIFGSVSSPTLDNAPFAGAQAVLQTYAQQILNSIQKDGFYVRVPSGKQFYLYVLQTIDVADASLGGTTFTPEKTESLNP